MAERWLALSNRFEKARVDRLKTKVIQLLEDQKKMEEIQIGMEKEILALRELIKTLNETIEGWLYSVVFILLIKPN